MNKSKDEYNGNEQQNGTRIVLQKLVVASLGWMGFGTNMVKGTVFACWDKTDSFKMVLTYEINEHTR